MKKLLLLLIGTFFIGLTFGQLKTVTGKVTDKNGQAVAGATIQVKGTRKSVVADLAGNYTILANSGDVLVITGVNLEPQEATVDLPDRIDIVMTRSIIELAPVAVTGSRNIRRSSTETVAPVDIIPVSKVMNQAGQVDVNQILQYIAPSFNSNKQSGADGSDHVDPASLRGLGPDQTLVLVNGKRRHQSSLINLYGSRGRGATGTDLNTIPAAAIERIEILRDAASSQYGSDAIAGVVNIILKNSVRQLTVNVMTGENVTGYGASLNSSKGKILSNRSDGQQLNANINCGFIVAKKGFINVTADVFTKEKTHRPNYQPLYPDNFRKEFGDMSATNTSFLYNSEIPLSAKTSFYSFGSLNYRKGDAFAYTREAESERNVIAIYPNGFDPHIKSDITDASLSLGIRTKIGKWNADFNGTTGSNQFKFGVDKSLNASLEAESPSNFEAGGFKLSQYVISANVARSYDYVADGLNLAAGTEFRYEQYNIFAGEERSYKTYGPVVFKTPNGDTVFNNNQQPVYRPGGSQGFPGFQPADVSRKNRNNIGFYADAELDVTRNFMVTESVRVENYSDFGSTFNFKLGTRLKLARDFYYRSSVSTGFRAPSLPQINFSSTFTDVVAGNIIDKKIVPNYSNIAKAVGIPELKQESSININAGFTFKKTNFSLTLDGYWVDIVDRIVLTGAFDSNDDKIGGILKSLNVGAAQFFTNAVDTRTQGIDLIATYSYRIGQGMLNTTFAGNFNKMEITKVKTTGLLQGKESIYFGDRERAFLLASAPPHKINLGVEYDLRKLNLFARLTHFAGVNIVNYAGEKDKYKGRFVADLTLAWKISNSVRLTLGGSNLLDVYATHHDPGLTETGGMWEAVQMGFGGAFYFARFGLRL